MCRKKFTPSDFIHYIIDKHYVQLELHARRLCRKYSAAQWEPEAIISELVKSINDKYCLIYVKYHEFGVYYLLTMMTNIVLESMRRSRNQKKHHTCIVEYLYGDFVAEPNTFTLKKEEEVGFSDLKELFKEDLSLQDHELLFMKNEGMSYAEISELIQMPLGTVGTNLHRARKKLVKKYTNRTGVYDEISKRQSGTSHHVSDS